MKSRSPSLSLLRLLCACALGLLGCERPEPLEATAYFEDAGPYPQFTEIEFYFERARANADAVRRCCEVAGLGYAEEFRAGFALPPDPDSGAKFNPAAGGACVAQTRERSCEPGKGPFEAPAACAKIYEGGRRKLGEACSSAWDCAPLDEPNTYAFCGWSDASMTKTVCSKLHLRKQGESCAETAPPERALCEVGLLCDEATKLCVPPAKLGETCITGSVWGDTCAAGAVCDRLNTKTCVLPKAVGEACAAPEECEYLACIGGVCREPLSVVSICDAP